MESAVVVSSSLEVTNLQYAEKRYGTFVDVYSPMFNVCEFQKKRDLPLNEECAKVFYARTAHLKDIDFVEIDRSILEIIGFKNSFAEKKDREWKSYSNR